MNVILLGPPGSGKGTQSSYLVKKYGLKKSIEGEYNENDKCLIIEDTITTGSSALQFINNIK